MIAVASMPAVTTVPAVGTVVVVAALVPGRVSSAVGRTIHGLVGRGILSDFGAVLLRRMCRGFVVMMVSMYISHAPTIPPGGHPTEFLRLLVAEAGSVRHCPSAGAEWPLAVRNVFSAWSQAYAPVLMCRDGGWSGR